MWVTLVRNKALLLPLWLVTTAGFAIAGAGILNLPKFYRLSKQGVHANALVTALEPNNHNAVYYSYNVNGLSYSGAGTASSVDRQSKTMTIGETVPIVYDPADPNSSCLGDPNEQFRSLTHGVIFISCFPTISFFVLYLRHAVRSQAAT